MAPTNICIEINQKICKLEVESLGPWFFTTRSKSTHLHPSYHFILLREGACTINIGKRTIRAPKGSILFINPMIPHSFVPDQRIGARHESLICTLQDSSGENILLPIQRVVDPDSTSPCDDFILKQLKQPQINHFCNLINSTKEAASKNKQFYYQMNLYTLFFYSLDLFFGDLLASSADDPVSVSSHVIKAKEVIAGEYNNLELNITMLAQRLGIHPNYLNYLFKKHEGVAVGEYLQNYRFNIARQFLTSSDVPVGTIANSCGFEHHSSFTRKFRKLTGLSPKDYRKQADG